MENSVVHTSSWALSAGGRPIELYSGGPQGPPAILLVGGVHGDEPEGVRLATDLLAWLQKNHSLVVQPWALIPCLNKDGFASQKRTNDRGVDLNRNFPSPDWVATAKAPRYYPGPHPESEPEVLALCQWISRHQPKVIVHFHSWEPCVVYTGHPGKPWAEIIATETPYPVREDIGYPTPGSLGQYGWTVHRIPVVCVEEQEKVELQTVWPRFQKGLVKLLCESH